ncbi:MAG: hypothetical protein K5871_04225 [Lachnospiraceae bacterium]|nr:hypothetical protein [Lachnospiraceae bacterium]
MKISRLFSYDKYKGSFMYLDTQAKYEIARTILYFAVSFGIFFAGFFATGTRINLLTVVAVLGMLPASKSLVSAIMFLRYKSCTEKFDENLPDNSILNAYDMVFTSEKINYPILHLCVSDTCVIGYTEKKDFKENLFKDHISSILSAERIGRVTIKIFTDKKAYISRISSLGASGREDEQIMTVLKQIVL